MATFLPAAQMPRNAMLNFKPLNDSIDDYQKASQYAEQETYNRRQNAEVMDMRRQEFAGQQEDRRQRQRLQRVQSLAGLAQMVDAETDPNQRAARWNTILQSDPRLASSLPEQYRDPVNGPKFLIAEAQGYVDPMKRQQQEAQLALTRAQIEKARREASGQATDYGKTGAVFQGQDGQFYTIQFGSDGSRRIEPVVTGGQNLTPARGVQVVGDEVISSATGGTVRNVAPQIAGAEEAKVTGRETAELRFAAPKARAAMESANAKSNLVLNKIAQARPMINRWTVGYGSLLSNWPATQARDLREVLKTIVANMGFDELQEMRANSPTGGALGQVAVQELEMLQKTRTSLDQAQSVEQMFQALTELETFMAGSRERRERAYSATYGQIGSQQTSTAQGQVGGEQPPQGVDPGDWQYMTPEERALFR